MTPIRLGVAGCARILPAHLRGIAVAQAAGADPFRITALCARQVGDALMFRRRGEGPPPRSPASDNENDPLGAPHRYVSDLQDDPVPEIYDDWRAMVESGAVDAVLILAPVSLHHQIAIAALEAGKHVLIEKPLAISVRAGQAIVDAAARHGRVAGVAENVRYAPRTRALRSALDSGLIGEPQLWLSGGIGGEWAPDRVVAHTPWRHVKLEAGGGPAIDHGVHLMHQIRYLMGPVHELSALTRTMEPIRVDERTGPVRNEVEDAYLAQLRFQNGAIGTVFSAWAGRGAATGLDASPVIYGGAGCIKGADVITADGARRPALELLAADAPYFPHGIEDSFALELLDFAAAIGAGTQMEASAAEGVLDLAMAYAILESAQSGGPVRIDDVVSGAVADYQADIDAHYGL
ncbi:MAG TPA: Gfo/Idh/MocA family oxidoreductase [Mycobacteriales bacterium]|nr:Gfo/Idh/MocA family oxidoreductase [Mycobacteriales bacterium]